MQGKLRKVTPDWLFTVQLVASIITLQAFKVFDSQDVNPLLKTVNLYTITFLCLGKCISPFEIEGFGKLCKTLVFYSD